MRRTITLALAAAALALPTLVSAASAAPPSELAPGAHPAADSHANDRVVYHYDRSQHAARQGKPSQSPNMTYHGGKILTTAVTKAIFWGPSWSNTTFASDKITGIDSWYTGYSGSRYAGTSTEYTSSSGARVSSITTHQGSVVDLSTASGGGNSSTILAEVARNITPDPSGNGYYPVYTDVPRGNAGYCAWHSSGTISGIPVQFAFFWNLDGDPGCDPSDPTTTHSQGLEALANVTGHELAEAMTDPTTTSTGGAWYDGSGAENGDKCAWTFNVPSVSFSNGTSWKIQGEWSNAAYTAGTGYPNRSGQNGCLSGF